MSVSDRGQAVNCQDSAPEARTTEPERGLSCKRLRAPLQPYGKILKTLVKNGPVWRAQSNTRTGQVLVAKLLAQMQSGAYA